MSNILLMLQIVGASQLIELRTNSWGDKRPTLLKSQMDLDVSDGELIATVRSDILLEKIELNCEQSTALIPRVEKGELDLALVSRDHPRHGTLLFHEPLVWVGSAQFQTWRRDPLPIDVYESTSLAKRSAINSLALQGRRYKAVYNSSSLAGQLAAVESGLAIAVLTQCSAPDHLETLGAEHGLGPLEPM